MTDPVRPPESPPLPSLHLLRRRKLQDVGPTLAMCGEPYDLSDAESFTDVLGRFTEAGPSGLACSACWTKLGEPRSVSEGRASDRLIILDIAATEAANAASDMLTAHRAAYESLYGPEGLGRAGADLLEEAGRDFVSVLDAARDVCSGAGRFLLWTSSAIAGATAALRSTTIAMKLANDTAGVPTPSDLSSAMSRAWAEATPRRPAEPPKPEKDPRLALAYARLRVLRKRIQFGAVPVTEIEAAEKYVRDLGGDLAAPECFPS